MIELLISLIGIVVLTIFVCFYIALARYVKDFWQEDMCDNHEDWYTRHKNNQNNSDNERTNC